MPPFWWNEFQYGDWAAIKERLSVRTSKQTAVKAVYARSKMVRIAVLGCGLMGIKIAGKTEAASLT